MPGSDIEERKTFKENTRLHVILSITTICLVVITLNMGIPIKVVLLLVLSITMTFFSVFLMVWCFTILEEKRILEESRREFEKSQQSMEQPHAIYNSTDNVESVKSNP
ncbi:unnamed protein product [Nezara viridula]|uniref:Uncharacterized protein n=1 Tax=Nezara viridula TaxID=85310 RepID=A0A9P0GXS9_NEZVI|nr:unnamed protein product [Nezara viridula]